jgi:hypothetical protein
VQPSWQPSSRPSRQPTEQPSSKPSLQPTGQPTDGDGITILFFCSVFQIIFCNIFIYSSHF